MIGIQPDFSDHSRPTSFWITSSWIFMQYNWYVFCADKEKVEQRLKLLEGVGIVHSVSLSRWRYFHHLWPWTNNISASIFITLHCKFDANCYVPEAWRHAVTTLLASSHQKVTWSQLIFDWQTLCWCFANATVWLASQQFGYCLHLL